MARSISSGTGTGTGAKALTVARPLKLERSIAETEPEADGLDKSDEDIKLTLQLAVGGDGPPRPPGMRQWPRLNIQKFRSEMRTALPTQWDQIQSTGRRQLVPYPVGRM